MARHEVSRSASPRGLAPPGYVLSEHQLESLSKNLSRIIRHRGEPDLQFNHGWALVEDVIRVALKNRKKRYTADDVINVLDRAQGGWQLSIRVQER